MIEFEIDNSNDICAYCRHMRKYHYSIYDARNKKEATVCSPKILGFTRFCGCQKFQESKEKRNGSK